MQYAKHSDGLVFLIALTLGLDQRIDLQVPVMVLLAMATIGRYRAFVDLRAAAAGLLLAIAYVLLNTFMMYANDLEPPSGWWAAPGRILLYYALFMMLAAVIGALGDRREGAFKTLEWLFVVKVILIAVEGMQYLRTGAFSERPLFNLVLADDSLLGVRFTSSYDFLFPLLALTSRATLRRISFLVLVNVISETRAVLGLSVVFLFLGALQTRSLLRLTFAAALPLLVVMVLLIRYADSTGSTTRLTQVSGSSLDDKVEQVVAFARQVELPDLVAGRGLGTSLRGITRDEARPYSYEAQVPVMLMQGGIAFFVVHFLLLRPFIGAYAGLSMGILLAMSTINPLLFSLASAFFLLVFGDLMRPLSRPETVLNGTPRGLSP